MCVQASAEAQYFTLFLTNPVLAFVRLSGCHATAELMERLDTKVAAAHDALYACAKDAQRDVWGAWSACLACPFARRLIVRFASCSAALRWLHAHKGSDVEVTGAAEAIPPLPDAVDAQGAELEQSIADIWELLTGDMLRL